MQLDFAHFTPVSALIGGLLLGLSAAVLILFNGRVAGVSGILGGFLGGGAARDYTRDFACRSLFIAGLLLSAVVYAAMGYQQTISITANTSTLVVAGLLVGFGARLCSGCTSGHGVCGLARLSVRSLVATLTFIAAGMVTVFVVRHVL